MPAVLVGTLVFAVATMSMTQTMGVPLATYLGDRWGVDRVATSWVVSATLLSSAAFVPVAGRLGDLYGKRLMVTLCLVTAAAGTAIAAAAGSLPVMVGARVLQGLGSGVIPLVFGIVREELPPRHVVTGSAMVVVGGAGVGAGCGPVVVGWLLGSGGSTVAFAVMTALIAVAVVAARWTAPPVPARMPAPVPPAGRFDIAGSVGFVTAVTCLLLALTRGSAWGWSSAAVIGLALAGLALGVAWVCWERRHPVPLVDFAVNRRPAVLLAHVAGLCVGVATFGVYTIVTAVVTAPRPASLGGHGVGLGRSVLAAGLIQLPGTFVLTIALVLGARSIAGRSLARVQAGGALLMAAGFVALGLWHDSLGQLVPGIVVVHLGIAAVFTATPPLLLGAVSLDETAAVNAVNAVVRQVGSVLAASVGGVILAATARAAGDPAALTLGGVWGVVALVGGMTLVAGLSTMTMVRRQPRVAQTYG